MSLYLLKRGSIYYFRRAVPPELQAQLARTEFVFSLKTKDIAEAKRRRTSAIAATDELLADAYAEISAHSAAGQPFKPDPASEVKVPCSSLASQPRLITRSIDFRNWEELLDLWKKDRNPIQKTQDYYLRVARLFHGFCSKNPSQIEKTDIVDFKNYLIGTEKKTNKNAKEILSKLHSLFSVAVDNQILEFNPATGVKVSVKRGKNDRLPYSFDDLCSIFSDPVFTSGYRPTPGRGEAIFFIPIMMLMHGMRPREIAQARIKDIQSHTIFDHEGKKHSWPFLHITEDEQDRMTVKNAESIRYVPIHPVAIALHFIDYIQELREAKEYWAFPKLKPDKYGNRAAKWSEWFNPYLRNQHGITDKRKVLYSLRHTFKDLARDCGVPDELQRALMGHAGIGVADTYGTGFGMYKLLEAIRMIRVPSLTINGVKL